MPDFRVPGKRSEDPRLREAGLAVAGLLDQCGAWSMEHGTDGWVPLWLVRSWAGGLSAARKATASGLWSPHRRGSYDGYLFDQNEWQAQQTPAAEIERKKELDADRARRYRQIRKDKDLRNSGQLTTGLVGVDGGSAGPCVTQDVTAGVTRDARGDPAPHVAGDLTPNAPANVALPPGPGPCPESGLVGEGEYGSERGRASTRPPVPGIDDLPRSELERLDPRCSRHRELEPGTPTPACRDCAIRRRAIADALGRLGAGELAARRATRDLELRRIRACPDCDDHSWVLGVDGTPIDPATRCAHPRVVDAELVDARPDREAR